MDTIKEEASKPIKSDTHMVLTDKDKYKIKTIMNKEYINKSNVSLTELEYYTRKNYIFKQYPFMNENDLMDITK